MQKKVLEQNLDEIRSWFAEEPTDDPDIETIGYVLQAYDVSIVWSQVVQEMGTSVCGQTPQDVLTKEFPR